MLNFDHDLLGENLTFCRKTDGNVPSEIQFDDFKGAKALVEDLWPNFQLKEELSLKQDFKGNKSIHLLFVSLLWPV